MIRVQREDFDVGREMARLAAGRTDVGAVVSFLGRVRDFNVGQDVHALVLEHYPEMARRVLMALETEATARWSLSASTIIHRFGRLAPGDNIVLVITAAAHRDAAFEAARFLMDRLKTEAPFWKREEGAQGARWVTARESDAARAHAWREAEQAAREKAVREKK